MNTDLKTFNHDVFGMVRTTADENGQIFFCGRDIATALGYENPGKAIRMHCRQDGGPKRYPIVDALGRTQEVAFITEGDLYRLIVSSHLPAAERFETWVMEEVLPSIRKYGMYAKDELLANPEILLAMAQQLVADKRQIQELKTHTLVQAQQLAGVAPKVTYYKLVLQTDDLLPITVIAKDYGLSAKALNKILHEEGVQYKQSGVWVLYAKYQDKGYTSSKTHLVGDVGSQKARVHTYWTQAGRLFIYDVLKNRRGLLPLVESWDAK